MLAVILLVNMQSGAEILRDASRQIDAARSITVTSLTYTEEFKRERRIKYSWRKGGYFRAEHGAVVDVSNPKQGWTYNTAKKTYQARPSVGTDFSLASMISVDALKAGWPIVGKPQSMKWNGRETIRVEVDGRALTKETKLFMFFEPRTHLPVGISANLGSATQVTVLEHLKLNRLIKQSAFQFTPPKGWKKVTASTGGWR